MYKYTEKYRSVTESKSAEETGAERAYFHSLRGVIVSMNKIISWILGRVRGSIVK